MRIVSLVPEGIVNAIYRSVIPLQALAHRGHAVHIEERNEPRNAEAYRAFDVVHFVRFCHPSMERLARALHDAHVPIVWDNDDDLLTPTKGNPNFKQRQGLQGRDIARAMTSMMTLANAVTTPSALLAQRYREVSGCDARVLENYLPPMFSALQQGGAAGTVRVGWIAGGEHQRDVDQLHLRERFEALLERHENLFFASVGVNLGLRRDRYEHTPIVAYGDLPQAIATFDVAIAPLGDTPFNRARSNIKLKEYAAAGVPWLASPIGPYGGLGEQQGGRLVADEEWEAALEALVVDRGQRVGLGRQGLRWAREHTIEQHAHRWEQTFEDAIAHARETVGRAG